MSLSFQSPSTNSAVTIAKHCLTLLCEHSNIYQIYISNRLCFEQVLLQHHQHHCTWASLHRNKCSHTGKQEHIRANTHTYKNFFYNTLWLNSCTCYLMNPRRENGFNLSCASDLARYNFRNRLCRRGSYSELKLENDEVKSTVIVQCQLTSSITF